MSLFEKQINHYYNETGLKRFNKLYSIDYVTNFDDNEGVAITYSQDVNRGYSDNGDCIYLLSLETDNWVRVAEFICNRYGCELDVDNEKLVAKEDYALVQTMLAIYAWIEFKEYGL